MSEEKKGFTLEWFKGIWGPVAKRWTIAVEDLEIEVKRLKEEVLEGSKRENLRKVLKQKEERLSFAKNRRKEIEETYLKKEE